GAVAAGCAAFRLSVEWARVEPAEGAVDDTALDRYAAILDACGERGLEPLVTLHHFTHPAWLGEEFWLSVDAPERFAAWAALAAGRLADRCRQWVTLNEINVLALQSYLTGVFPPGRRAATGATVRALDHLVSAHVLAYGAVRARRPDVLQLDWYDPVAADHFRLPGHRTAGGRTWLPARMLWDDPVDARAMAAWCRLHARDGLPLWIVENGLCNRVVDGRAHPRTDGW